MLRPCLFGPVNAAFAEQNLAGPRASGTCLTFSSEPGTDLLVKPGDSWEAIRARFPIGWQPDYLVLYLPYNTVPRALLSAPLPIVALAPDWNLLWHSYRRCLPSAELVFTDPLGV